MPRSPRGMAILSSMIIVNLLIILLSTHVRQLAGRSPALPHVASTLRQKMAVFQSLMEGEEGAVGAPQGDVSAGGGFMMTEHLSEEEKENHHPPSAAPNKRRRVGLGPPNVCEGQMREAPSRLTQQQQQDGPLELQSPRQAVADDPADLRTPPLLSLLDMKPEAAAESSSATPAPNKKRKQVHFGVPLSPELFDRDLPPSTPLQRGGAPARVPTPARGSALRSLLKTPQRSDAVSPEAAHLLPDLSSASPQLALPRSHRTWEQGDGAEEDRARGEVQIVFPLLDELDVAEHLWGTQMDLAAAFCDEPPMTSDPESDPTSLTDASDQLESLPDADEQPPDAADAPSRTRGRKKEVASKAPERSSRKRKLPEDGEPAERLTRSAAKSASGKMKKTFSAARCWTKEVNRSLYGSREYASKMPTLSPITEREAPASCTGHVICDSSPAAAPTNDIQELGVVPLSPVFETPSDEPVTVADEGPSDPPEVEVQGRSEPDTQLPPHRDPSEDDKSAQRKRRGRRSSVPRSDERQETGRGAADGHKWAGRPGGDLSLWQSNFNVENVFKPVATRGQHSVRRSLRNQSGVGGEGAGLAWLPQTPPTDAQERRRRTCKT